MQGNLEFGFELETWFVMISLVGLPPGCLHHTHGHHPNQLSGYFFMEGRTDNSELRISPVVQFSSVTQLCPTLCNPMDCSTPGLPVYHRLPEFTQTHVHHVGDATQSSHLLSSPSPPQSFPASGSFQISQFFTSGGQSIGVSVSASVLMNIQDWLPLEWTGLISLQFKGLSRVFSNKSLLQHSSKASIFCAQLSL